MKVFLTRAIGTLAIAGALTLPSVAGVTGTEGGTNTTTTTRTEVHTQRTTSTSNNYLAPIYRDLGNKIVSYSSSSSYNYISTYASDWRTSYWLETGCGEPVTDTNVYETGRSSWLSFLRNAERQIADVLLSSAYTKTGETLERTESDQTITDSPDLILIGDTDAGAGGYAAQGTRDKQINIVDYIWDNMHRTDTRQKTFEKWKEYNHHTAVTYTVESYTYAVTPIVLNMDGTGQLGASAGKWLPHEKTMVGPLAVFDFFGSGEPVLMEWVKPQDGLLCRPKQGPGPVDGSILFGSSNGYENGFQELAILDVNLDGRLTGKELDGLFVWQDVNGNAIPGKAEVKTVQELGITEISVNHKNLQSSFVRNGKAQKMWDWNPLVRKLQATRNS